MMSLPQHLAHYAQLRRPIGGRCRPLRLRKRETETTLARPLRTFRAGLAVGALPRTICSAAVLMHGARFSAARLIDSSIYSYDASYGLFAG